MNKLLMLEFDGVEHERYFSGNRTYSVIGNSNDIYGVDEEFYIFDLFQNKYKINKIQFQHFQNIWKNYSTFKLINNDEFYLRMENALIEVEN
jgi:hypothetical protein